VVILVIDIIFIIKVKHPPIPDNSELDGTRKFSATSATLF